MAKIQAIILAGGRGTRLAPLTDTVPKPLVPVAGQPMMAHVLSHLRAAGITTVAVAVSYLGEMIENEFGDGSGLGMHISYLREPTMMGTGGWAKLVDWALLDDAFLVLNADNLFWIDITKFLERHREVGALASIAAVELPSDSVQSAELLLADASNTRLDRYIDRTGSAEFITSRPAVSISSGWYVMSPGVRRYVNGELPYSNETHLWPALAASRSPIGYYQATEPWFDSGTHERLARVEKFLSDNPHYL